MLNSLRTCHYTSATTYIRAKVGRVGYAGSTSLMSSRLAQKLRPDVLFCNHEKIPDIDNVLWQGPWQWALYDVVDTEVALRWIHRGVHFIETWNIGALVSIKREANR